MTRVKCLVAKPLRERDGLLRRFVCRGLEAEDFSPRSIIVVVTACPLVAHSQTVCNECVFETPPHDTGRVPVIPITGIVKCLQ